MRYYKEVFFAFALVISSLIIWHAIDVFLLVFATILLAVLLYSIGDLTKKCIHLPYLVSLFIALVCIIGILTLIFWLYSPLISKQFQILINTLPKATARLRQVIGPYLSDNFLSYDSLQNELSLTDKMLFSRVLTIFSSTIGSIVSFVIFVIVGFYLAILPSRYLKGVLFVIPTQYQKKIWDTILNIGHSLRFWLLGKLLSMIAIGILTYIGLWFLDISLAFILGLLAGLLAFIPYVGSIVAAIPAILIAFTESPLTALYVLILYLGVHAAEGYLITPFIEQKTVSIPPALTIMGQILLYVLVGGLGLALATPLIVVIMTLTISLKTGRLRSSS